MSKYHNVFSLSEKKKIEFVFLQGKQINQTLLFLISNKHGVSKNWNIFLPNISKWISNWCVHTHCVYYVLTYSAYYVNVFTFFYYACQCTLTGDFFYCEMWQIHNKSVAIQLLLCEDTYLQNYLQTFHSTMGLNFVKRKTR